ncbi:MAG: glycosyltransferase family protein [Blastocatellia bacterium]
MTRLMVYSHDTYGLGNLRRMLSICRSLIDDFADLTVLLLSGSPMIQGFRLPARLDYVKLPCLTRAERESYVVRSLDLTLDEAVRLRSALILAAASHFRPDLFLVDKKPCGVRNELEASLAYLAGTHPRSRQILILRDILDSPEETIRVWERNRYHELIREFYDRVLVLGMREIFDPCLEYRFPEATAERVRFCGYLRRAIDDASPGEARQQVDLAEGQPRVLVTVGGGQDGYQLLAAYLESLSLLPAGRTVKSLVVCGPEMGTRERRALDEMAAKHPAVILKEFTDNLVRDINDAALVVSMGGYNTVCEILTARKNAIVVPRVHPVREQWIRAERMAGRGLFRMIHPDRLTPALLSETLRQALEAPSEPAAGSVELNAQARIAEAVAELL